MNTLVSNSGSVLVKNCFMLFSLVGLLGFFSLRISDVIMLCEKTAFSIRNENELKLGLMLGCNILLSFPPRV